MDHLFVPLDREPPVRISCTFIPPTSHTRPTPSNTLIVFLSGMDNPQKWWFPTISHLQTKHKLTTPMLTYDRPGCGTTTDRNPDVEIPGRPRGHGRDCLDAAHDLRLLIIAISKQKLGIEEKDIGKLRIVFVANSMGVAIGRIYAALYPRTVSGFLMMDSTLANSDSIDIFPDPDADGFDAASLPTGVTPKMCIQTRETFKRDVIYYKSPNREGLWRGTAPTLLPHVDLPKLEGPTENTPFVTVLEHDRELWIRSSEEVFGVPEIVGKFYGDPCWHEYHLGLARLTKPHLSKGPLEAKGAGHVIHRSHPEVVALELAEILDKLSLQETTSHI